MLNWDWLEQLIPPYNLALVGVSILIYIAFLLERMRKNLRAIHFMMADDFREKHGLDKIGLNDLP